MHPVFGEIVGWEFLLVLAVIALLFGGSKVPQLARSLGQASSEFRKGLEEQPDSEPEAADHPGDDSKQPPAT
jgi:sec-independent protein translocase protein TatA